MALTPEHWALQCSILRPDTGKLVLDSRSLTILAINHIAEGMLTACKCSQFTGRKLVDCLSDANASDTDLLFEHLAALVQGKNGAFSGVQAMLGSRTHVGKPQDENTSFVVSLRGEYIQREDEEEETDEIILLEIEDISEFAVRDAISRVQKSLFDTAMDALNDCVLIIDENATIMSANDAFLKTFHLKSWREVFGKSIYKALGGALNIPSVVRAIDEILTHRSKTKITFVETPAKLGDKNYHLLMHIALVPDTVPDRCVLVFRDESKIAHMRAQALRTEDSLQTRFDAVCAPIFTVDPQLRITEWNIHCSELFGFTRADAIGESILKLCIPTRNSEAISRCTEILSQAFKGMSFLNPTVTVRNKSGKELLLLWRFTGRCDKDGNVQRLTVLCETTERWMKYRDRYKAEKKMREDQVAVSKAKAASVEKERDALKVRLDELEDSLRQKAENFESEVGGKDSQLGRLRKDLREAIESNRELSTKVTNLKFKLEESNSRRTESEKEAQRHIAEIRQQHSQEIEKIRGDVRERDERIDALNGELQNRLSEVTQQFGTRETVFQAVEDQLRSEVNGLKDSNAELQNSVKVLTEEKNTLSDKLSAEERNSRQLQVQVETHQSQSQRHQDRIEDLQKLVDKWHDNEQKLRGELERCMRDRAVELREVQDKRAEDVREYSKKLEGIQQQWMETRVEIESIRVHADSERQRLHEQLSVERTKRIDAEKKMEELQLALHSAKSEHSVNSEKFASLSTQEQALEASKADIAKRKEELSALESELVSLRSELKAQEEALKKAREANEHSSTKLEAEFEKLTGERKELELRREKFETEKAEFDSTKLQTETSLSTRHSTLSEREKSIVEQQDVLNASFKESEEIKAQKANLEKMADELRQKEEALQEREASLESSSTALRAAETAVQSRQSELDSKLQHVSEESARLAAEKEELQRSRDEVDEHSKKVTEEAERLKKSKELFDEASKAVEESRLRNQEHMEELKKRLEDQSNELEQQRLKLVEASAELNESKEIVEKELMELNTLKDASFYRDQLDTAVQEHNKKTELLQMKVDRLDASYTAAKEEAESAYAELNTLKQKLMESNMSQSSESQETIRSLNSAIATLKAKIEELENQKCTLEASEAVLKNEISDKNNRIDELTREYGTLPELREREHRYEERHKELMDRLAEVDEADDELKTQRKELQAERDALAKEREELKGRDIEREALRTELEMNRKELDDLNDEIQRKREELASVGGSQSPLKIDVSSIPESQTDASSELSPYSERSETAGSERSSMVRRRSTFVSELPPSMLKSWKDDDRSVLSMENCGEQLAVIAEELEHAETYKHNKGEQLTAAVSDLSHSKYRNSPGSRRKSIKFDKEKASVQKDRELVTMADRWVSLVKRMQIVMEAYYDKCAEASKTAAELERCRRSLRETGDELRRARDSGSLDAERLAQEKETLTEVHEDAVKSLNDEITALRTAVEALESEKQSLQSELREKSDQLVALEAEMKELEPRLQSSEQKVEFLTEELGTAKADLDDIQKRNKHLESSVAESNKVLHSSTSLADQYEKQVTSLEAEVQKLEAQRSELQEEISKAESHSRECEAQATQALSASNELQHKLEMNIAESSERISALELDIGALKEEKSEMESSYLAERVQTEKVQTELRQTVDALAAEKEKLVLRVDELTSTLNTVETELVHTREAMIAKQDDDSVEQSPSPRRLSTTSLTSNRDGSAVVVSVGHGMEDDVITEESEDVHDDEHGDKVGYEIVRGKAFTLNPNSPYTGSDATTASPHAQMAEQSVLVISELRKHIEDLEGELGAYRSAEKKSKQMLESAEDDALSEVGSVVSSAEGSPRSSGRLSIGSVSTPGSEKAMEVISAMDAEDLEAELALAEQYLERKEADVATASDLSAAPRSRKKSIRYEQRAQINAIARDDSSVDMGRRLVQHIDARRKTVDVLREVQLELLRKEALVDQLKRRIGVQASELERLNVTHNVGVDSDDADATVSQVSSPPPTSPGDYPVVTEQSEALEE